MKSVICQSSMAAIAGIVIVTAGVLSRDVSAETTGESGGTELLRLL